MIQLYSSKFQIRKQNLHSRKAGSLMSNARTKRSSGEEYATKAQDCRTRVISLLKRAPARSLRNSLQLNCYNIQAILKETSLTLSSPQIPEC